MLMRLNRLYRDVRGVSAVEFALIAPVMVGLYLGMAEFCQGFMAQKRMGHVAAMVADLVSQQSQTNRDGLEAVLDIGEVLMEPFPTTTLRQRVSSITRGQNGVVTVDWSYASGLTPLRPGDPVTIPANLIVNGESLVMAEAEYDYDSLADYVLPDITTFQQTYYLRPRSSNRTECTNC